MAAEETAASTAPNGAQAEMPRYVLLRHREIPDLHRQTNHLLVHFDHLGERVPDPVRDAHGHAALLRRFAK